MEQLDIYDVKDVLQKIRDILQNEERHEFNSHEFICRYRRFYEKEYISMLNSAGENAFQKVNAMIAVFLSVNSKNGSLNIQSLGKVLDRNDHYEETPNENWKFI